MKDKEIIEELKFVCPILKKDIETYCKEFSGIYLHLIFGDILNPYLLNLLNDVQEHTSQLIGIANLLELMSKSSESIQEVVVTTVLERLSDEPVKLKQFKMFAGEHTLKCIDAMSIYVDGIKE